MSERWGNCRSCGGKGSKKVSGQDMTGERTYYDEECGTCGGTGESGDIQDYLQKELEKEPDPR